MTSRLCEKTPRWVWIKGPVDIMIDLKLKEYDDLLSILASISARPGMYGVYPDSIELLARHLSHICFCILFENWEFHKTEGVWKHFAKKVRGSDTFADVIYESQDHRENKWGASETAAKETILSIYRDLLSQYGIDGNSSLYTKRWIKEVEFSPSLLGSPDATDGIFFVLALSTIEEVQFKDKFREKYFSHCRQIRGDGRTDLHGLKAKVIEVPTHQNYSSLTSGITKIYSILVKLRKILTRQSR